MISNEAIRKMIGAGSNFAKICNGYEDRLEQLEMSFAVADAFNHNKILLVEAGTGVGKTMAYLAPAILKAMEGLPLLVSTNTIALQSQLVSKDIPDLINSLSLSSSFTYELVKGRGNYVCLSEVDYANSSIILSEDPLFAKFKKWLKKTKSGDKEDLDFDFPSWLEVRSDIHTCKKDDCKYFQMGQCFYYNMRKKAGQANLIITNHSLFFSDLACKLSAAKPTSETAKNNPDFFAGILPSYSAVIFDEAHHLEDSAGKVFGVELSSGTVPFLMKRLRNRRDFNVSNDLLNSVSDISEQLFSGLKEISKPDYFLDDAFKYVSKDKITELANNLITHIDSIINDMTHQKTTIDDKDIKDKIDSYIDMLDELTSNTRSIFFEETEGYFRWGENKIDDRYNNCILHSSPVSVSELLSECLFNRTDISMILTSATLSNAKGFEYIKKRLGIDLALNNDIPEMPENITTFEDDLDDQIEVEELVLGSPFDYERQMLLYVPKHTPAPVDSDEYAAVTANLMKELLDAAGGHAFLLFTSYKMLNRIFEILNNTTKYRLLKQGDMSNEQLLTEFRRDQSACLMGVASFWEGIDVKGDRLRLVIIDKIPFAVPDNPTTKSRCNHIEESGGNSFLEYSVPSAIIKLKQGFGRLIRTKEDKGIVAILDSRIHTKFYRKDILNSFPKCKGTIKIEKVKDFFSDNF